jgi:rRNA maturation endonuclease Nob1
MSSQMIVVPVGFYQLCDRQLRDELAKIKASLEDLWRRHRALCERDGTGSYEDIALALRKLEGDMERLLGEHTFEKVRSMSVDHYARWLNGRVVAIREELYRVSGQLERAESSLEDLRERLIERIRENSRTLALYAGNESRMLQEGCENLERLSRKVLEERDREMKRRVEEFILALREEIARYRVDTGGDLAERIREFSQLAEEIAQSDVAMVEKVRELRRLRSTVLQLRTAHESLRTTVPSEGRNPLREKIEELRKSLEREKREKKVAGLRERIDEVLARIRNLDHNVADAIVQKFPPLESISDDFALANIYDQLQIEYVKLKEDRENLLSAQAYRGRISELLQEGKLPPDLQSEGEALLGAASVSPQEYRAFIEKAEAVVRGEEAEAILREVRKGVIERLTAKLQERGYRFLLEGENPEEVLERGQPVRVQILPEEDYLVLLKVDQNGAVITRFVREIEDAGEANPERDKAVARSWCAVYKEIVAEVSQKIPLRIEHLVEPDEVDQINYLQVTREPKRWRVKDRPKGKTGRAQEREHP